MTLARFRAAAILLGAVILVVAAVAAIVDLAGGPDLFGDTGTIVWGMAMLFFGVVTARESEEKRLRVLGVITAVAAAVVVVATISAI